MQLHYKASGRGRAVILLHGLFGGADNWHPIALRLAENFQVFALDETIAPTPIKTYADLTAAMSGHVLASGEVVALAHAPDTPPPAPAAH